jgi:hypothetical protein
VGIGETRDGHTNYATRVSEVDASEPLADLAFAALDHAVSSVEAGGPLIPFAMTEDGAGRNLTRFMAEPLEEGQERARQHARAATEALRVAITFDGYLTVEGERSDAVFVEAQERGTPSGIILAQRYRPGGRFKKFSTVGNPAHVGQSELF